jgi:hypothetical protein
MILSSLSAALRRRKGDNLTSKTFENITMRARRCCSGARGMQACKLYALVASKTKKACKKKAFLFKILQNSVKDLRN